jgi:hypothetical protein
MDRGLHRVEGSSALFVLLSFEGPDRYATAGHETHVVFVGDPSAPGDESPEPRLHLHRWGQWISRYYPGGVYDGEEAKLRDVNESLPAFIVDALARPAIEAGRLVVVMGEEWHIAEMMCRVSARATARRFVWERVLVALLAKVEFAAGVQRVEIRPGALATLLSQEQAIDRQVESDAAVRARGRAPGSHRARPARGTTEARFQGGA